MHFSSYVIPIKCHHIRHQTAISWVLKYCLVMFENYTIAKRNVLILLRFVYAFSLEFFTTLLFALYDLGPQAIRHLVIFSLTIQLFNRLYLGIVMCFITSKYYIKNIGFGSYFMILKLPYTKIACTRYITLLIPIKLSYNYFKINNLGRVSHYVSENWQED